MLRPASDFQIQLEELWTKYSSHPDYLYWNADASYNPLSEIKNSDYRKDEWVSVVDGMVVGYLCALIDKNTRSVADISIASFTKNPQYGFDFFSFIKYCERRYLFVRWAAVDGHPNEKTYERIIKHYGGRVVGVFKKKIKLHNGRLKDEKWYEIDNQNRINGSK